MSAPATAERPATVDAARSALHALQQALAAALTELATATAEEAQAKERFTDSESQRLRKQRLGRWRQWGSAVSVCHGTVDSRGVSRGDCGLTGRSGPGDTSPGGR